MADRFADEPGYRYVNHYPIYQTRSSNRVMFYLIHASEHPEAPKLMARSYQKIVGGAPGTPADAQLGLFSGK